MDKSIVLCFALVLVLAVTATGVNAVSRERNHALRRHAAAAPVSLLSLDESESESESEPVTNAVPVAAADYSGLAAEQERPEPVPPPRPPQFNHAAAPPKPAAAAPAPKPAAAPAPAPAPAASTPAVTNLVATAATATSTNGAAVVKSSMSVSTTEAIENYNQFLSRNFKFAQSMGHLFKQCDLNADGAIDIRTELPKLVADNVITQQHANVIASWDIDGDHQIRRDEWNMGPLYVSLLQYNPMKKTEFEQLVATNGDTTEITKIFARMAKGDAQDLPKFTEMRLALRNAEGKSEEELQLDAELEEQAALEEAALKADDTARFAQRHGRRRKHAMSNKAARKAELLAQKRPTSKHGIPSEADEHCVMCQFLVQRIQKQLYYTLSNGNDGFPADPNAEISAKKMKQVNSQLLNRRGGKGMLRILSEDIVSDMCEADQMPELYYSACKKIDKAFPVLLDAIYFQFHSEAVCEEAKMCGASTYFNSDTSVHLPSKSIVFNSGRGKCGLMGGARERADAFFSAALCFAKTLFIETATITDASF